MTNTRRACSSAPGPGHDGFFSFESRYRALQLFLYAALATIFAFAAGLDSLVVAAAKARQQARGDGMQSFMKCFWIVIKPLAVRHR